MTGFKRVRQVNTESQDMISFRLPSHQVRSLDECVAREGSSRTAVMRAALAAYIRMQDGMFVPMSIQTANALQRRANIERRPAETIAQEILKRSLQESAPIRKPLSGNKSFPPVDRSRDSRNYAWSKHA